MQPRLFKAANGHLTLEFDAYGSELQQAVGAFLVQGLGFERCGETADGWDVGVAQSFRRGEVLIEAGWCHWADGDYLLSACVAGDALLRRVFMAIEADLSFRLD